MLNEFWDLECELVDQFDEVFLKKNNEFLNIIE